MTGPYQLGFALERFQYSCLVSNLRLLELCWALTTPHNERSLLIS